MNRVLGRVSMAFLTGLAVVLTACSADQPGNSTPQGQTSSTSTTATTPSNSLANFDACAALQEVASSLNLIRIEEAMGNSCEARYAERTGVRVIPFPDLSIEQFVSGPNTQLSDFQMSGHKAKRAIAPTTESSCSIIIEITPTSRVDVAASSPSTQEQACEAATQVATAIEPSLP